MKKLIFISCIVLFSSCIPLQKLKYKTIGPNTETSKVVQWYVVWLGFNTIGIIRAVESHHRQ